MGIQKNVLFYDGHVFFFVAIFGGAGMFGARQQGDNLFDVASRAAAPQTSNLLNHRSRRLLSVEEEDTTLKASAASFVTDPPSTTSTTEKSNPLFGTETKAVALWQDLTFIHSNTNYSAASTCGIDDLLGSVTSQALAQGTLMPKQTTTTHRKQETKVPKQLRGIEEGD